MLGRIGSAGGTRRRECYDEIQKEDFKAIVSGIVLLSGIVRQHWLRERNGERGGRRGNRKERFGGKYGRRKRG